MRGEVMVMLGGENRRLRFSMNSLVMFCEHAGIEDISELDKVFPTSKEEAAKVPLRKTMENLNMLVYAALKNEADYANVPFESPYNQVKAWMGELHPDDYTRIGEAFHQSMGAFVEKKAATPKRKLN